MNRLINLENVLGLQKHEIIFKYHPERKQFYKEYLHSEDTRRPQEVKATVNKVKNVTKQNLIRLEKSINEPVKYDREKYKNCIFICLHGIPPYPDEFDFLNLPGECFFLASNGFEFDKDEAYIESHLKECRFGKNAQKIHKIVQQNSSKDVIFVYHSFGTFNLGVYFEKYGFERVKGLIELGPATIRHYRYASEVMYYLDSISEKDLLENKDKKITNEFQTLINKINQQQNLNWANLPSVAYTMAFLSYFKSAEAKRIFQLNRRFPNVLKFISFGEEDAVFTHELLCERAEFYSRHQLQNQAQFKQKLLKGNNLISQNLQQNFIYMFKKGKHSLHLQKTVKPILAKAVQQYLELIFN